MKLSISVEALERLLGGDTELEIQLRHQVAQQFIMNHFTKFVQSKLFNAIRDEIHKVTEDVRNLANQKIAEHIGIFKGGGWRGPYEVQLLGHIQESLNNVVNTAVWDQVGLAIKKNVKDRIEYYEKKWASVIDERVQKKFDEAIEKKIQEGIESRLKLALIQKAE